MSHFVDANIINADDLLPIGANVYVLKHGRLKYGQQVKIVGYSVSRLYYRVTFSSDCNETAIIKIKNISTTPLSPKIIKRRKKSVLPKTICPPRLPVRVLSMGTAKGHFSGPGPFIIPSQEDYQLDGVGVSNEPCGIGPEVPCFASSSELSGSALNQTNNFVEPSLLDVYWFTPPHSPLHADEPQLSVFDRHTPPHSPLHAEHVEPQLSVFDMHTPPHSPLHAEHVEPQLSVFDMHTPPHSPLHAEHVEPQLSMFDKHTPPAALSCDRSLLVGRQCMPESEMVDLFTPIFD